MKRVLRLAALIGALVISQVYADDPPKDGAKKDDATKLLGKWQAVSGESAGKQLTAEMYKYFGLEIDEEHFTIMIEGKPLHKHTYKIDPAAKPKSIAMQTVDTRVLFDRAAIYELDGDTLKFTYCFGDKPPTALTTKDDGSNTTVYVLKRQ